MVEVVPIIDIADLDSAALARRRAVAEAIRRHRHDRFLAIGRGL